MTQSLNMFLGLTQKAQTYTDLAALFHSQRVGCAERIRRMAHASQRCVILCILWILCAK